MVGEQEDFNSSGTDILGSMEEEEVVVVGMVER